MNLIFAESNKLDELTLKRLLLVSQQVTFIDMPSLELEDTRAKIWSQQSSIKQIVTNLPTTSVKLNYENAAILDILTSIEDEYIKIDRLNKRFINIVIDAIKNGELKTLLFNQVTISNSPNSGYKEWIIEHSEIINSYDFSKHPEPPDNWKVLKKQSDGIFIFSLLLSELSIGLTTVLLTSLKYNSVPIFKSKFFNKLLTLRLTDIDYIGESHRDRNLPLALIQSVLSDKALLQIPIESILTFREKTQDYYDAWLIEINRLQAELIKSGFSYSISELDMFIKQEINPRIFKLKREIEKTRDDMFKNIITSIANTTIATVVGGTLSSISIPAAVGAFIIANIKTPKLIENIIDVSFQKRQLKKDNGLTYMLEIQSLH